MEIEVAERASDSRIPLEEGALCVTLLGSAMIKLPQEHSRVMLSILGDKQWEMTQRKEKL